MINREIHDLAVTKGICKDWAKKLKNATNKELSEMFFDGSDWAFKYDFPTIDLLKDYKGVKEFGLVLDAENETFKGIERLAFFGDGKAKVVYENFEVADVYVRHGSDVEINASNYAIVSVSVEDNASVHIVKDSTAKVNVRWYSGVVSGDCNIRKCKHE